MYLVNRLETNCRISLIPFHAIWGLCWYNFSARWKSCVEREGTCVTTVIASVRLIPGCKHPCSWLPFWRVCQGDDDFFQGVSGEKKHEGMDESILSCTPARSSFIFFFMFWRRCRIKYLGPAQSKRQREDRSGIDSALMWRIDFEKVAAARDTLPGGCRIW